MDTETGHLLVGMLKRDDALAEIPKSQGQCVADSVSRRYQRGRLCATSIISTGNAPEQDELLQVLCDQKW